MKILYAVQGTGNGHIVRAAELIPAFQSVPGVEVDILISGTQHSLELPFDVRFRRKGLSFVFGKSGGIDFFGTMRKINCLRLLRDIYQLPVKNYDLVISDFEPVSVWAARLRRIPCIGISNQAALNHPQAPKPFRADPLSRWIAAHYATAKHAIGFHYQAFDESVLTPPIRQAVRRLKTSRAGHYCVYLPAYSNVNILRTLRLLPDWEWKVFSTTAQTGKKYGNIEFLPVDTELFLTYLASCNGLICNAGFGITTEALFLGKKMLVIPMKNQYEQQCNAAALAEMGIKVFGAFHPGNAASVEKWLFTGHAVKVEYPDHKNTIVSTMLHTYHKIISGNRIIPVSESEVVWDDAFIRQRI